MPPSATVALSAVAVGTSSTGVTVRETVAVLEVWPAASWISTRTEPAAPRKIAFVKLSEMGAILLAVPAFHAARSRVGSENLYCIVLAGNREVHELIDVFPPAQQEQVRIMFSESIQAVATQTLLKKKSGGRSASLGCSGTIRGRGRWLSMGR